MFFIQMIPRNHRFIFLAKILGKLRITLETDSQRLAAIGDNRKELALASLFMSDFVHTRPFAKWKIKPCVREAEEIFFDFFVCHTTDIVALRCFFNFCKIIAKFFDTATNVVERAVGFTFGELLFVATFKHNFPG